MELNTEINKIFGTEMAKLFALQITEKELQDKAKTVWHELNKSNGGSWSTQGSDIDKLIKGECLKALKEEVKKVISTEEYQKAQVEEAKNIVDEITKRTKELMIEEVSQRLSGLSVGYGGIGIKNVIEQTVLSMLNR